MVIAHKKWLNWCQPQIQVPPSPNVYILLWSARYSPFNTFSWFDSGGPLHVWNPVQHSAPHRRVHHLSGLPHAAVTGGLGPVHHSAQHEATQTGRAHGGQRGGRCRHGTQLEGTRPDLPVNICTLTPFGEGRRVKLNHAWYILFCTAHTLIWTDPWSVIQQWGRRDGGSDCVALVWLPSCSELVQAGAWTQICCTLSYIKKSAGMTESN